MARITPLLPAGPAGILPARRAGRSNTRLPAECRLRPLAGRPDALPRERRVCYRKLAPSAALSSWKTDLDQFVDTATPSPEASIWAA
ncbi:hypothetical protein [Burkholderia ambifaria]|uniref:hypothetical protein n=1 Tax=Burkholderia ambifaria TaxID=152480 RepID=UPI00158F3A97|nr:hypothetical protein [Burkholderia ambifaria]